MDEYEFRMLVFCSMKSNLNNIFQTFNRKPCPLNLPPPPPQPPVCVYNCIINLGEDEPHETHGFRSTGIVCAVSSQYKKENFQKKLKNTVIVYSLLKYTRLPNKKAYNDESLYC